MASVHVKRFQDGCRYQVRKGLVNQADGSWREATSASMDLDMMSGYKVSVTRQKKEKAATARGGGRKSR